jgi:hypothetical protein
MSLDDKIFGPALDRIILETMNKFKSVRRVHKIISSNKRQEEKEMRWDEMRWDEME